MPRDSKAYAEATTPESEETPSRWRGRETAVENTRLKIRDYKYPRHYCQEAFDKAPHLLVKNNVTFLITRLFYSRGDIAHSLHGKGLNVTADLIEACKDALLEKCEGDYDMATLKQLLDVVVEELKDRMGDEA